MRKLRRKRVAVASMAVALAAAGSAAAFQQLPANDQVNNDLAAGINPALRSTATTRRTPTWSAARSLRRSQKCRGRSSGRRSRLPRRIRSSSRSFAGGVWTTRGNGTVGGRSSASPESQRLAELRSGPGRRGAVDRFRGNRTHRPLGDLVREHLGNELRRQQHLRQPVRQHRRCQSGQVDLRRSGPGHRRRQPCRSRP